VRAEYRCPQAGKTVIVEFAASLQEITGQHADNDRCQIRHDCPSGKSRFRPMFDPPFSLKHPIEITTKRYRKLSRVHRNRSDFSHSVAPLKTFSVHGASSSLRFTKSA